MEFRILYFIVCNEKKKMNSDMITTISPQSSDMSTVDALWVLIQSQKKRVRKILTERLVAEQNKTKRQKAMVKESLARAFDELHSDNVHHNARNLFD